MSKFKKGDFVVWNRPDRLPYPIYCTVDTVLDLPAIDEPYYICFREMTANGKPFRESYEFWEHELDFVDMKGAKHMTTKEKQLEMIANMITDITMIGVTSPVIERIVKYSADVIDMYKEEENHE